MPLLDLTAQVYRQALTSFFKAQRIPYEIWRHLSRLLNSANLSWSLGGALPTKSPATQGSQNVRK